MSKKTASAATAAASGGTTTTTTSATESTSVTAHYNHQHQHLKKDPNWRYKGDPFESTRIWLAESRPQRVDMIQQLCASEHFLIDGDSLFIEALLNQHCDWDLVQPLHVVYLAEEFVARYLRLGGNFSICFFQQNSWWWTKRPQFEFARTLLLQRLIAVADQHHQNSQSSPSPTTSPTSSSSSSSSNNNTSTAGTRQKNNDKSNQSSFSVAVFQNYTSKKFLPFCQHVRPEFALVNDGCQFSQLLDSSVSKQATASIRAFAMYLLSVRLNIAFTSRQAELNNTVYCFAVRVSVELSDNDDVEKIIDEVTHGPYVQDLVKAANKRSNDIPLPSQDTAQRVLAHCQTKSLSARDAVTQLALVSMFQTFEEKSSPTTTSPKKQQQQQQQQKSTPSNEEQEAENNAILMAKVHLLSNAIQAMLPVSKRALNGGKSQLVKEYLSTFSTFAAPVAFGLPSIIPATARADEYADATDGHLLARVADLCLSSATGCGGGDEKKIRALFTDAVVDSVGEAWKMLLECSGFKSNANAASIFPLSAPAELNVFEQKPAAPSESRVPAPAARNIPLAKQLASSSCNSASANVTLANWSEPIVPIKNSGWKQHLPGYDTCKKLDEYKEIENMDQKMLTKFVRDQRESAESMNVKRVDLGITREKTEQQQREAEEEAAKKHHNPHGKKEKDGPSASSLKLQLENTLGKEIEAAAKLLVRLENLDKDTKRGALLHGSVMNFVNDATDDVTIADDMLHKFREFVKTQPHTSEHKFLFVDHMEHGAPQLNKIQNMDVKLKLTAFSVFRRHCALRAMQMWLYQLWTEWEEELRQANDDARLPKMSRLVDFFLELQRFVSKLQASKVALDTKPLSVVCTMVNTLNFGENYQNMIISEIAKTLPTGAFRLDTVTLPNATELEAILKKLSPWCAARFQLCVMGELLERERGIPDKRMPFPLDPWQKKLLDAVDDGYSAVVTAPTSSGKTFIALYAMTKTLRQSDNDVVVYVCPTRALVNQALGDSWARFGHKEYKQAGQAVVGVLGGGSGADGWVMLPFNCQVLVTIPEVLEVILLSPAHQEWAARIKFVVFDEIHAIESSSSGAIWERLLMTVRCPFVALSATLGNTDELVSWLNRSRSAVPNSKPVVLIPGPGDAKIDRFNDIEKHVVLSDPVEVQNVSTVPKNYSFIDRIHPLSCIGFEMLRSKGVEDLRLVPSEVVELYDALHAVLTNERFSVFTQSQSGMRVLENISQLEPGKWFAGKRSLTKTEARGYEDAIVRTLCNWSEVADSEATSLNIINNPNNSAEKKNVSAAASTPSATAAAGGGGGDSSSSSSSSSTAPSPTAPGSGSASQGTTSKILLADSDHLLFFEMVQSILAHFGSGIVAKENRLVTAAEEGEKTDPIAETSTPALPYIHPESPEYVKSQLLPLLVTLHDKHMTPTIVFTFSEEDCEAYTDAVVNHLEAAESQFRSSPAFQDWVMEEKLKFEAMQRETASQANTAMHKERKRDAEGNLITEEHENKLELKEYVVPEVLPMFSFKARFSKVSQSDWQQFLHQVEAHGLKENQMKSLKRGIAVHHNGIVGRNRRLTERMFRQLAVPIIICTETLALGIHSPCKTCVIAGDSMRLTTSQFRQMSGRAGRRGEDFLGHCIFLGVPLRRIQRLLTSDLDRLKGHVTIDPSTLLRIDTLVNFSPEHVRSNVEQLVRQLFIEPLLIEGRSRVPKGMFERFSNMWSRSVLNWAAETGFVSSSGGQMSLLGTLVSRVCGTLREVHTGPGSFLFAFLLASGALHRATISYPAGDSDECLHAMYQFMSLLFSSHCDFNTPLELHESILEDATLFTSNPNSTSIPQRSNERMNDCRHAIILPSWKNVLGGSIADAVKKYNQGVLQCAVDALRLSGADTLPANSSVDESTRLPLSDYSFPTSSSSSSSSASQNEVAKKISEMSNKNVQVRHPLSALSGADDDFACSEDLCRSLRDGFYVDSQMLPTLDLSDSGRHDGRDVLMNACVSDYLLHGFQNENGAPSRKHLFEFNGLTPRDSWYTLVQHFKAVNSIADFLGKDFGVAPGEMTKVENQDIFKTDDHVMVALLGYQDRMTELASSLLFSTASSRQFNEALRQEKRAKNRRRFNPSK